MSAVRWIYEPGWRVRSRERGVTEATELDADALRELVAVFTDLYRLPTDRQRQLRDRPGGVRAAQAAQHESA